MRLLHTTELRFQEFLGDEIPKYAILSHTWGSDEVSYQDFLAIRREDEEIALARREASQKITRRMRRIYLLNGTKKVDPKANPKRKHLRARTKKNGTGYQKILACCRFAATDNTHHLSARNPDNAPSSGPFDWVWIDTCCIDKSSSAELSEAINSMYDWYHKGAVCYVYLWDVSQKSHDLSVENFTSSRWFGRGWTLQEFLAPDYIQFLDQDWTRIGSTKDQMSILRVAIGIREGENWNGWDVSLAKKLSWAASRKTTRPEDEAYCLFGILGVNMPLLYGEQSKAFRRLQLEILRTSSDESIFAWDFNSDCTSIPDFAGILAPSISTFKCWRFLHNVTDPREGFQSDVKRLPYSVTNQGLEVRVPQELARKWYFLLPLTCSKREEGKQVVLAILLRRLYKGDIWYRYFADPSRDNMVHDLGLGDEVHRLEGCPGLYTVPLSWLWTRDSLEQQKSTIIYVAL